MSQENVEAYKRAIDAFNRRDLDTVLVLADEEVVVEPRIAAIEGEYHGHDGVRRWWTNLIDMFPDFEIEIAEIRDLGEVTLARLRLRAHAVGSAAPLDQGIWQIGRWRDGRYTWWRNCTSEGEALEAAGWSE
jgi:ketosteroid isomerase-like protein